MGLVDIGGQAILWGFPWLHPGAFAGSPMTMDAAQEYAAAVFQVPKTGNIRTIFLRTDAVATSKSVDVGLYTVDATNGNPTTPLAAYGGMAVGTIAAPAGNTNYLVILGTVAAVTKGDIVAVVVRWTSELDPGNVNITRVYEQFLLSYPHFGGYTTVYTGAWTKGVCMNFAVGYDDGNFYPIAGVFPQPTYAVTTFNSGSTPDELGNKFQSSFPCRMSGYWARWGTLPANGPTVKLYDSSDNVLASHTPDPEIEYVQYGPWLWEFITPVELLANAWYRLTVSPGIDNLGIFDWQYPSAAMLGALPLGTNCIQTQRTDGGAWTDNSDRRVLMGVLIDQLDNGFKPPQMMRWGVDLL